MIRVHDTLTPNDKLADDDAFLKAEIGFFNSDISGHELKLIIPGDDESSCLSPLSTDSFPECKFEGEIYPDEKSLFKPKRKASSQLIPERKNLFFTGRTFTCHVEKCGKFFSSKKLLRKHMQSHKLKRFECHYEGCNKTFYERAKLKRHFIVHTGEKNFVCSECNKSFGYKANLKTHMRTHTGEKPYICTVAGCTRRFAQASNRNAHVATHQKNKKRDGSKIRKAVQERLKISSSRCVQRQPPKQDVTLPSPYDLLL